MAKRMNRKSTRKAYRKSRKATRRAQRKSRMNRRFFGGFFYQNPPYSVTAASAPTVPNAPGVVTAPAQAPPSGNQGGAPGESQQKTGRNVSTPKSGRKL